MIECKNIIDTIPKQPKSNSILAVYFSEEDKMGYPFDQKEYFESYKRLSKLLSEKKFQMVIVRGNSYLGKGSFSHGWQFADDSLEAISATIHSTVIWNRDDKNTIPNIIDHPIINPMELDQICLDKKKTAKFFPEFSPKTKILSSYEQLAEVIKNWQLQPNELLVLKKNFETEGRGISIKPVSEVSEDLYTDWQGILVQEFCDSSGGIPGLVEGLHDLRITTMNGTIAESFIRTPTVEGEYRANTALGGFQFNIETEKIPQELQILLSKIDQKLSHFTPRLYAADFFLSQKGWKLIELNSRPGMPEIGKDYSDDTFIDYYFEQLINFFTSCLDLAS